MSSLWTLLSAKVNTPKWQELDAHQTPVIANALINIDHSIWYSGNHGFGEKGMGEYCKKTLKIINVIKYPQNIKPWFHSLCKHKNKIYIIDGENGQIILFNPITKQFTMKISIPKIGYSSCCTVLHDDIHIFHGETNKKHIIYSIKNNTLNALKDEFTTGNIGGRCSLKYQKRIIRFGGVNYDTQQMMNTFIMSSQIKPNKYNDIKWIIKPEYKLPKAMTQCGSILYKHLVITFGGDLDDNKYCDKIYILNLNTNCGWQELKRIHCPFKSQYVAILTNNNEIHLFTGINQHPNWEDSKIKHYSLPISAILGEINDKSGADDVKCNKCDELEEQYEDQIQAFQQQIEQLIIDKNEYLLQNKILTENLKMSKDENVKLNEECKETKLELKEVKNELNKLKRKHISETEMVATH